MAYGVILGQSFGKGLNAKLYVTYGSGVITDLTSVTATAQTSGKVYNGVYDSTNQRYIVDVDSYDIYSVTGTLSSGVILPVNSTVNTAQIYNITLTQFNTALNDTDWNTISLISQDNLGDSLWAVGDAKQIVLDGEIDDGLTLNNYSTYVFILGFNHNETLEGQGITFGGFKSALSSGKDICLIDNGYNSDKTSGSWFNMNNFQSNSGGWNRSRMRTVICPAFKSAMPADLQAVLKTVTKYSDNTGGASNTASYVTATSEEVFLLAEFEVFGARSYANSAEQNYQAQYAYYSAGNSKVKYRHSSTSSTAYWWLRSVRADVSRYFCVVATSGSASSDAAYYSLGFAPAFVV